MQRESGQAGSPGRTLVELIVGAAAAALLSMAVVSLLIAGLRWHRPDESALIRQRAVRNGLDWIVRDLRRAERVEPLPDGVRIVLPREERVYRVADGALWLDHGTGSRLVAAPVTAVVVSVDPFTRAARVEVQSAAGEQVYHSVSQIMPRVVVP